MFSCKKNKENDVYRKIYNLHQKVDTISKDSMKFYLKNAKELFSKKGIYPDSLKAENNFLIGKHFDKSNNLDSTLFYYNKAIDYDTDNIISDREFDYYYQLILKYYYDNNLINAINYADKLILNLDTIEYRKLGLVYNHKFTIIPTKNSSYIGKIKAPIRNSGKLKIGQKVNIKLVNYPSQEFGILNGIIKSMSQISDEQGNYLIDVSLPNKLITSYQKDLEFKQEMQGTAEIITEDLRLIERFFYQIRGVFDE